MNKTLMTGVASCALLALGGPVMADSLTPTTFTGSVGVGGTTNILNKVGTITMGMPTTANGDVMFVVDTTGSMGPGIAAVTNALGATATALAGIGTFNFGLGQYKDRTNDGADPFDYNIVSNVPESAAMVKTELGTLTAAGGGDDPEQGLFALQQASTTTTWDAGFKRLAVIVGDAPSHSSGTFHNNPKAAGGASVGNTATTLNANGVTMIALNASALTGDSGLDSFGQFTNVASHVPGSSVSNFSNTSTLTKDIIKAVGSAFASYSNVSLGLVGPAPADCSVTLPAAITGSFTRATTHAFDFGPVGVKGLTTGTCSFEIGLFENGALIATETDTVTVGPVTTTPEPASLALLATGLLGLGMARRRKKQS